MDQQFLRAIQAWHPVVFDVASQVMSRFVGSGFVWLLIIGALFLEQRRHFQQAGQALALGFMLEVAVVEAIIKPLIARPRPFWVLADIRVIDPINSNYSFPSGHVAILTVAGWILSAYFPKTTWLWVVLILLAAWSRVYNGVHWPSDVLGGVLIGSLIGWLTLRMVAFYGYHKVVSQKKTR